MDQICPKRVFPVLKKEKEKKKRKKFAQKGYIRSKTKKVALLRASLDFTYYIKVFSTGADRHNGILMSLLLLVAKTKELRNHSGILFLCPPQK